MEIIFVLVPLSMLIVMLSIWAFVWSARNRQFEDLNREAYRILADEEEH